MQCVRHTRWVFWLKTNKRWVGARRWVDIPMLLHWYSSQSIGLWKHHEKSITNISSRIDLRWRIKYTIVYHIWIFCRRRPTKFKTIHIQIYTTILRKRIRCYCTIRCRRSYYYLEIICCTCYVTISTIGSPTNLAISIRIKIGISLNLRWQVYLHIGPSTGRQIGYKIH